MTDRELPARDAQQVLDQMPVTHGQLADGLDSVSFAELARLAAHDVYRASKN